MTNDTLKPCPFCGHLPVHRQMPNDGRWMADCNTAACIRPSTGILRSEAEAITAWNTRTPPTSTDERKDVLEEAARLVEAWNGDTRDGDTFLIAAAIRALTTKGV